MWRWSLKHIPGSSHVRLRVVATSLLLLGLAACGNTESEGPSVPTAVEVSGLEVRSLDDQNLTGEPVPVGTTFIIRGVVRADSLPNRSIVIMLTGKDRQGRSPAYDAGSTMLQETEEPGEWKYEVELTAPEWQGTYTASVRYGTEVLDEQEIVVEKAGS